ncbi:MAG: phosphoribosylformimino-5-aminoimidazole carboxamide ribotide isomerase [Lachnospiraceae bacterium]|nr:phosphoribosylformimino-5-aminoimidazole carboxamide ribotide isomerase [Lachnospiraceae bacterium]
MKFRPCIDIHNGKVKQIVGSSLRDEGAQARENYISSEDASFYAKMFKDRGLYGGHMIILNKKGTPEYEMSLEQCMGALDAFPGGLQVGGGVTAENAMDFINAGASHVIVTSYVFSDGRMNMDNLEKISSAVTPAHLVLDMSCKEADGKLFVMTDRWQKKTENVFDADLLEYLAPYCDEFLVHAVDSEGKSSGPQKSVLEVMKGFDMRPVTYAGGIASFDDIRYIKELGEGRIDFTIGSALDIYGGHLPMDEVILAVT